MSHSAILLNLTVMMRPTNLVITPCRFKGFHLLSAHLGTNHSRAAEVFSLFSPASPIWRHCSLTIGDGDCSQLCRARFAFLWCCPGMTALVLSVFPDAPLSGSSHTFVFIGSIPLSAISRSLQKWECQNM
jgi:hypothetical protein